MAKQLAAVLGVLMLASACAFVPHEADIEARAPLTGSTIGEGVAIDLQVLDDRETTDIGKRAFGELAGDITADDVVHVLEREVVAIFESHSFEVVPLGSDYDADVEVRLRSFKFFLEPGWWTGEENTNVVVAVEAEKGDRDFDLTYRSTSKEDIFVAPGESAIDDALSDALTDVLRQFASDLDLMNFLAR